MMESAKEKHDQTKISGIDQFFSDFKTEFKEHSWYDNHKKEERHHIQHPEGVRSDVDLIDVLEYVADCVMAGMARSGSVYDLKLPDEVLRLALKNTTEKLKAQIEVKDHLDFSPCWPSAAGCGA